MENKLKMKGIILAGGTATRLFPLTATTSKQLLPVYDRQMIFYPLNTLIKAGIKDILIIVAPDHSGQYLNLLGSFFKNYGIHIYFEIQNTPRGLADAFILGENFIDGDDVTMILGDNIFEDDFSQDIIDFQGGGKIFAKKVQDWSRFGIVKFDENKKVVQIVEKPQKWISDYAIPGIYIYDNQVSQLAKKVIPSKRGEIEITSLHNAYLKKGELDVGVIDGVWLDAGTYDSLLEAGKIVKKKKLYQQFHPLVEEAMQQFNQELKISSRSVLLARVKNEKNFK